MNGQREIDPGLPEGATAGISEMAERSSPDPADVVAAGPAGRARLSRPMGWAETLGIQVATYPFVGA